MALGRDSEENFHHDQVLVFLSQLKSILQYYDNDILLSGYLYMYIF